MPTYSRVINVTAGTTSNPVDLRDRDWSQPLCITALPGAGGTVAVETSTTPTAVTDPNNAKWTDSGNSNMSVQTELIRFAPCVAVRLKAATANGSFEVMV